MLLWPRRTEYMSRSQMILIDTFSPSTVQGLSKMAQFECFAVISCSDEAFAPLPS